MTRVQTQTASDFSAMSLTGLHDFSLVNGGLLNRFWRRMGLSGDELQLVPRSAFIMAALG